MICINNSLRVRYSETDQMGFVYYGNYAQYLEVARVELFRSIGISYKDVEDKGFFMPVSNLNIDFKFAAKYDDLLNIETKIIELPKGVRIKFDYNIFNQDNKLIASAQTTLFFMNKNTNKICPCPDFLTDLINPFFI